MSLSLVGGASMSRDNRRLSFQEPIKHLVKGFPWEIGMGRDWNMDLDSLRLAYAIHTIIALILNRWVHQRLKWIT